MMTEPGQTFTPEGAATDSPDSTAPEAATPGQNAAASADSGGAPEGSLALEVAGLKDRLLRTMAEMENLRRRTEKEVADAKTYGVSSFARDMLTVADNLQRAMTSLGQDVRAEMTPAGRAFVEGVELTERDFVSRLARHGIKPIEAAGQKFDPNKHEALFELPDATTPSGTIVQVLETGYQIGERVLRPAKVGVARGGPKAEAGAGEVASAG